MCIIDQSNWSGPFSLVVMTPDFEGRGFKHRSEHSTGNFYLQVYFSSNYKNIDTIVLNFFVFVPG